MMIAAVPGEFTTMAGRRLRKALDAESVANGGPSNTKTVIAGLSNVYTHYITTFEEYQVSQLFILFYAVIPKFVIAGPTLRRCFYYLRTAFSLSIC